MCHMNRSVRGEDSRQGSRVGVLCRSGEWEAKQVNTQCQSEFFFLPHSTAHTIYLCVSQIGFANAHVCFFSLFFSPPPVFVICIYKGVCVKDCGLSPLYTHIKRNGAPKGD